MDDLRGDAELVPFRVMLWRAWTPVAWSLPPFLLLFRFANGGWETLLMLLSLPVWWPALSLLGLLPRTILRGRGFTAVPVPVAIAMAGCIWGLLGFALSLRGAGDNGAVDSVVGGSALRMTGRLQDVIAGSSIVLVLLGYLVAVLCASVLRPREPRSPAAGLLGGLILVLGVIAVPVVLVFVALGIDRAAMHGARDSAGSQEVDVVDLTAEQGRARQERNWDGAQRELVSARSAIGAAGWLVGLSGGIIDEDRREGPHEYRVRVVWDRIDRGDPGAVGDRLLPLVERQGWEPYEGEDGWGKKIPAREIVTDASGDAATGVRFHLRNRNGYALDLVISRPAERRGDDRPELPEGSAIVTLELTSGRYWAESLGDADWYGVGSSAEAEPLWASPAPAFAADAWPELRLVENQPAAVQPR